MDYKELQEFIKEIAATGLSELDLKTPDFDLKFKRNSGTSEVVVSQQTAVHAPMALPVASQNPVVLSKAEPTKETKEDTSKYTYIKSPMVGTFYRRAAPDKANFVAVGDEIRPGQVICIIEAMKLFNEIESEVSGRVVKILVDDATPVEFDQALFVIEAN